MFRDSALRLAHLIESDGPGGAERVVADLASEFQARGAMNVVFLPEAGDGWLERQLRGTGVTIEYFRIDRPFSPACARSLADGFRRHRIDLAHSHEFSMAVYGAYESWSRANGNNPMSGRAFSMAMVERLGADCRFRHHISRRSMMRVRLKLMAVPDEHAAFFSEGRR